MKSKKKLVLITVVLAVIIVAVCVFALRGGEVPVTENMIEEHSPEAAIGTEPDTAATETLDEQIPQNAADLPTDYPEDLPKQIDMFDGVEADVLEDDEIDEGTLTEDYSDFKDVTVTLPIVP